MVARVYNPVTNQFTSPDPVKGGNENRYTYPNDPVNKADFSGQVSWGQGIAIVLAVNLVPQMFAFGFCSLTGGAACPYVMVAVSVITSFLTSFMFSAIDHHNTLRALRDGLIGAFYSVIGGWVIGKMFGFAYGAIINNSLVKKIFGKFIKAFKVIVELLIADKIGEAVIRTALTLASMILPPNPFLSKTLNI